MNLNELKRQMLQQRLDMLAEQYKAAHNQHNAALSATDRVTIDQMIKQLEQDISQVESELAALGEGSSSAAGSSSSSTTTSNHPVWKQIGIEMIRIPAGDFLYGDDKKVVYLDEFLIARTPVTNRQYEAFVEATDYERPEHWQGRAVHPSIANHPVVNVSWDDAQAFCEWAGAFLPMERQWEKAARGTDGRMYPWGEAEPTDKLCNSANNVGETTPVGRYAPQGDSPYGLVDVAGNVLEWCEDWYEEAVFRVLRGGSFGYALDYMRCSFRSNNAPAERLNYIGFRLSASDL